ncbi:hypothetical protein TNCV_4022691 [Trichonephila clavipes]|nr:hypothetical protein TNCV_4022691 [Trichonephila clavipes]
MSRFTGLSLGYFVNFEMRSLSSADFFAQNYNSITNNLSLLQIVTLERIVWQPFLSQLQKRLFAASTSQSVMMSIFKNACQLFPLRKDHFNSAVNFALLPSEISATRAKDFIRLNLLHFLSRFWICMHWNYYSTILAIEFASISTSEVTRVAIFPWLSTLARQLENSLRDPENKLKFRTLILIDAISYQNLDRGILGITVTNSWSVGHEFESSVNEDPPFIGWSLHVKFVLGRGLNVPWCGS